MHRCWDRLMEEEVLSNRSLNITVWDVRRVIRHSRNRKRDDVVYWYLIQ